MHISYLYQYRYKKKPVTPLAKTNKALDLPENNLK